MDLSLSLGESGKVKKENGRFFECDELDYMMKGCGDRVKENEFPATRYRLWKNGRGPKAAFVTRLQLGARNP